MGATQSIPVVGEAVTIVDSCVRTVAAGACAAVGNTEAAEELIKSADQSWVDYSEKSAIASNIQILANFNDDERKSYLLGKQGEAWTSLGKNTPVVSHVIGVINNANG
ncbi:hypothetical protein FVEN_g11825 [Fusarium venenatum]|uniref:Uncharacterized protein n=1 Tax=Fusarium venenatum TaxID=56646 RepID=A0A2L2TB85_9HYPO|nr:uncharacterized protein FVRRES_08301 [Fusarium venenatum]KAG8349985.1 hypothetical protein FVEN_g11825 [Fusarium venenatum]CEI68224.1 unnamed protein product [Fusarium venenatum]